MLAGFFSLILTLNVGSLIFEIYKGSLVVNQFQCKGNERFLFGKVFLYVFCCGAKSSLCFQNKPANFANFAFLTTEFHKWLQKTKQKTKRQLTPQ